MPWKIGQKIEILCRGGNIHSQITWEEIWSTLLMIRELQRKHSKIFFHIHDWKMLFSYTLLTGVPMGGIFWKINDLNLYVNDPMTRQFHWDTCTIGDM